MRRAARRDQRVLAGRIQRRSRIVDEHHRTTGGDLGRGDGQGRQPARGDVLADAPPGHVVERQRLEAGGIEEPAQTVDAAAAAAARRAAETEQPPGNANDVGRSDPHDALQRERAPDVEEPSPGAGLVLQRGDIAGVNGADAGAGHDVEAHRAPEPKRDVVEHIGKYAGLVGAARSPSRHDHGQSRTHAESPLGAAKLRRLGGQGCRLQLRPAGNTRSDGIRREPDAATLTNTHR